MSTADPLPQTILIVDDDPYALAIHRYLLESLGWAVETAANGAEAIRLARDHRPDAILLDLMMPGMDGGAVLRQLRSDPRTRLIPVIALTGDPALLQDHGETASEFDSILLKPVPHDDLIRQILRVISRR
jgi:CheY-like chemotaxis protein